MVKACCVPQCSSGVTIPAHYFPKDIQQSDSWASKIQCPVINKLTSTERRKYRVCYKHFEETSYLCFSRRSKLKNDAIPTLQLPVQSYEMEYAYEYIEEAEECPVFATPLENEAGPSTSGQLEQCSAPQRSQSAAKLYSVVKKLMKHNNYARRKREDLKARLKRATRLSESSLINRFENLSTTQKMFIEMQLRTSKCKLQTVREGRGYTTDEKILAFALLKQSPKSYKLLRRLCNLPSEVTLKKMLRKIPVQTGVSKVVMEHLHRQVDTMSAEEKLCILMWDEMAIKPHAL